MIKHSKKHTFLLYFLCLTSTLSHHSFTLPSPSNTSMASSKPDPRLTFSDSHQNYVVLPQYIRRTTTNNTPSWWNTIQVWNLVYIFTLLILAVGAATYALWPTKPHLKIDQLKVLHIKVHTRPHIAVDITLASRVLVQNTNMYSIDYTALDIAVGYRGKVLGHVMSGGGHVRPRGTSYVNATLEFTGVIVHDWIYLVDDLAKGLIRFDTFTQVDGLFGLFFFKIPFKVKLSCEIDVHTKNHTFNRENCYYTQQQRSQTKFKVWQLN